MNRKLLVPPARVGVVASAVAGCGTSGRAGVGAGGSIVVGTGDEAVFSRNPDYRGTLRLNNDKVELRLFTDEVVPDDRRESARSATTTESENAQKIIADDVPILPLWQGKRYIASRTGITGTEWALNSSATTQFWELGRGATG